jgi:hypothetical protein
MGAGRALAESFAAAPMGRKVTGESGPWGNPALPLR